MIDDDFDDDEAMMCPQCGDMVPAIEIISHDGVCKSCYDDDFFGEEPPFDNEED